MAATAPEKMTVMYTSCFAALHAEILSRRPMYWDATTAPPVAKALKSCMKRFEMLSTSEMPLTLASPTAATMMVSAMPMVMVRICSKRSGMISALRYDGVKSLSAAGILVIRLRMISSFMICENHVK